MAASRHKMARRCAEYYRGGSPAGVRVAFVANAATRLSVCCEELGDGGSLYQAKSVVGKTDDIENLAKHMIPDGKGFNVQS